MEHGLESYSRTSGEFEPPPAVCQRHKSTAIPTEQILPCAKPDFQLIFGPKIEPESAHVDDLVAQCIMSVSGPYIDT